MKKILLPVDFSEKYAGAARYARLLAVRFRSELILLHVAEPVHLIGSPEIGTLPARAVSERQAQMETTLREELQGLPVTRIVLEGGPADKIVEHAHAEQADLIVMPTHGYGPFRQFLLGSVTAKVLHDADCPVWTGVHLEEAPLVESIHKIACALDLGLQSEEVLSWAFALASAFGAQLSVIHVTPAFDVVVAETSESDPRRERARQAREEIEELQEKIGVTADITVDSGDVLQVIYDFAARLPADLLVIGRGSAQGLLGRLRANAYAIIRQSSCPVLSV